MNNRPGNASALGRLLKWRALLQAGASTTKKPEFDSGLLATFYTENNLKSYLDAAPQIYACQLHTV
ncbi:MAG TPA: hypothetical protein PLC99_02920 [Verrucomicrobiota bacterium]|nr:hypothetical protein [Verrucomicrobiota bacterium]